jgi:hypothetical protein
MLAKVRPLHAALAALLIVACAPADGGDDDGGGGSPDANHAGPPAARFASSATRWSVPSSGLPGGFFAADDASAFDSDQRFWLTIDLDGDGKPDLVQTADVAGTDAHVWTDGGGAYWKVYKNTGAGLAGAPTRWAVPSSGTSGGFFDAGNASTFDATHRYWLTMDLTGDGKPDLIQTADVAGTDTHVWTDGGGAYWKVYKNTGSGFESAASRWSVPASGASGGFFDSANAYTFDGTTRYWVTIDLTGDGKPDLVQTADIASEDVHVWTDGGGAYWKVYKNTGSGFDGATTRWSVPASGEASGFFSAGWSNTVYWSTIDLDGDGRLDLVQTADPAAGARVWTDGGGAYWKLYKNGGGGFAATATRWSVPSSGLADGFFADTNAGPSRRWRTYDADGDGKPDLVQTADTSGSSEHVWTDGGGDYWKVHAHGGDGFASAARWSVPPSGASGGFFDGDNAFTLDADARYWLTLDVDGDGRPDLVQTADTAGATAVHAWSDAGGDYWKVYLAQP